MGLLSRAGLLLTSNAGDGTGSWAPYILLGADGTVTIDNTLQGIAAARLLRINMTSGLLLQTNGNGFGG